MDDFSIRNAPVNKYDSGQDQAVCQADSQQSLLGVDGVVIEKQMERIGEYFAGAIE